MKIPAKLEYVGKIRNGISITLFGTYKSVVLNSRTNYIFEDKDRLDDRAKSYYRSLKSIGIRFIDEVIYPDQVPEVTDEPTEDTVEEVVTDEEPTEEVIEGEETATEPAIENENEDVSLFDRVMQLGEDEVKNLLSSIGFTSRKRSLEAKVSEALSDNEIATKIAESL